MSLPDMANILFGVAVTCLITSFVPAIDVTTRLAYGWFALCAGVCSVLARLSHLKVLS